MIKFFRRIRQDLLSSNKTSQYFKYAFGEIVLVVLGILIALSINNWNENRINNRKQEDYLIGLKNDLSVQTKLFDLTNQMIDQVIFEGEELLKAYNLKGDFTSIDDLNKKLTSLMYTQSFPEISTTFKELNSTGQFNLVKNKELRSEIIDYYQKSEFQQNGMQGNRDKVIYPQVFPIIKSMVIIDPVNFGSESIGVDLMDKLESTFMAHFNDTEKQFELLNAISLRIIIAKSDKTIITDVKSNAEELLQIINEELEAND